MADGPSQRLGDIAGDRLAIDCATCRRHGSYRLDGLLARFGPEIATLDLLRALTATCRHQRDPGAKAARKYESQCLATLRLPKLPDLEPPVPPGRPFAIEVWDARGRVELRLGVIYPLDGAIAAFEAVKGAYPRDEVTLRQGARVLYRRARPGAPDHVDANPGGV
ncbi:hypothetical protein GOFOIKOB_4669 [Methylobacterium tardum]|uniref:Uncharacterized protein n=1 Tax=Methylobacterium tardum TaxID=374432 RepID=A0AA37TGD0_9HYPH|nr:hypothetical protein [Methylobacterium tardum]URD37570.1 hypothetical protein M6G65_03120 [Methylobacterium tardum]GJE51608.1 hypothetical protein GOFOIKOB_4669 [Methylobacterium tardum]GLS70523.1 hypothetical protein GCM10007890_25360 [Methylobacterium tardum]